MLCHTQCRPNRVLTSKNKPDDPMGGGNFSTRPSTILMPSDDDARQRKTATTRVRFMASLLPLTFYPRERLASSRTCSVSHSPSVSKGDDFCRCCPSITDLRPLGSPNDCRPVTAATFLVTPPLDNCRRRTFSLSLYVVLNC